MASARLAAQWRARRPAPTAPRKGRGHRQPNVTTPHKAAIAVRFGVERERGTADAAGVVARAFGTTPPQVRLYFRQPRGSGEELRRRTPNCGATRTQRTPLAEEELAAEFAAGPYQTFDEVGVKLGHSAATANRLFHDMGGSVTKSPVRPLLNNQAKRKRLEFAKRALEPLHQSYLRIHVDEKKLTTGVGKRRFKRLPGQQPPVVHANKQGQANIMLIAAVAAGRGSFNGLLSLQWVAKLKRAKLRSWRGPKGQRVISHDKGAVYPEGTNMNGPIFFERMDRTALLARERTRGVIPADEPIIIQIDNAGGHGLGRGGDEFFAEMAS